MSFPRSSVRPILWGAVALLVPVGAASASVYPDLTGPNISYTNINESDNQIISPPPVSSTPTGLFGAPVLFPVGSDNLEFPSLTFSLLVASGQFEEQDGKLMMDLTPTSSDVTLHSLTFDEGGGWRVTGPNFDLSPDASLAEATLVFGDVRITSLNGVALTSPIVVNPTFSDTVDVQTGSATVVAPANGDVQIYSGGGIAAGSWDITASFDFDAALATAGLSGERITGLQVGLDDELYGQTTSQDGATLANIDKKHFDIIPVTTPINPIVPEPSAAALSTSLAAVVLMMRRRRTA